MYRYFHNDRLFARDYFERVLNDSKFPAPRVLPENWKDLLVDLLAYWESSRKHHMVFKDKVKKSYVGLPIVQDSGASHQ